MEFKRYHISAFDSEGVSIGSVDPGGSTDEPGVRCMFGWGVPSIDISLQGNLRDRYGYQILTEDAKKHGIQLILYGYQPDPPEWVDLGSIDGGEVEKIQNLLIRE